jgi:preprotein translocase subunit SecD
MSKARAVARVFGKAALLIVFAVLVVIFALLGAERFGGLADWLLGREGPQLVIEVEPDGVDLQGAVTQSIRVIERRLYEAAARATVEQEGPARIVVRLGPSDSVKLSIALAARRGRLEFRLIDTTMAAEQALATAPPPGSEVLFDTINMPHLVAKEASVSGRDVVAAHAMFHPSSQEPAVEFALDDEGSRRFGEITHANVGRALAIVFDGKVLSVPVIRTPITGGRGMIYSGFTPDQAAEMALLLRGGELPGRLTVVEQRSPKSR